MAGRRPFPAALEQRGYEVVYVDAMLGGALDRRADAADVVIVLGGPNGAYDEGAFPPLQSELQLIERRLKAGLPLLGICLGAQLLARVLGAEVKSMAQPEIGFGPLVLTTNGANSIIRDRAAAAPVLFWHQDTFGIPHGATHLASSRFCANQAFCYDKHVLALQFHLEPDPKRFEEWLVGNTYQLSHLKIDVRTLREDMRRSADAFSRAGHAFVGAWLDCIEQKRGFLNASEKLAGAIQQPSPASAIESSL
ncbi:gamma-glutamyl-gamma-aminobutyrate hydrolase family protein [Variovorax sp. E3]|uniref:glutamine amidotransferase-related protein n=1 Tax=Variovorax sp. E3 TaxID=1914993 RepID=UPI0022B61ED0|nr:gamma-glutamyl-gamma-aminobutyrate hydrolase family protein [Variovorax sp. E3]